MQGGSNTPLRGLGFAFLAFALFATHDAIIKALGQDYSVFQIIFFAMLFAFIPTSILMLADQNLLRCPVPLAGTDDSIRFAHVSPL